jgi:uncharacterized membrane protein
MNLKEKIRWVTFLPLATASLVSVYFFARIFKPYIEEHPVLSTLFFQVSLGCLASFISAFLFVAVGSLVAPKKQFAVARILAITFILLSVFKIFDLILLEMTEEIPWFYISLATIAGILGALMMLSMMSIKK